MWFIRGQMEPDGQLPLGVQSGQTVLYVEAGGLTVEAQGVVITPDNQVVDATVDAPIALEPGGSIMIVRDSDATLRNSSNQNVTFLMLTMFSAMDEGQAGDQSDQPIGFASAGISVGTAEFMPGPATLIMERVVLDPGDSIQNVTLPADVQGIGPGWGGIDLGAIEAGSAEILFENQSFQNLIWPELNSDTMMGPDQVLLSGSVNVDAGESYASFNSILTFTNTGDEPLVILRVIEAPHVGPGQ